MALEVHVKKEQFKMNNGGPLPGGARACAGPVSDAVTFGNA
jgi:hypothetical protein